MPNEQEFLAKLATLAKQELQALDEGEGEDEDEDVQHVSQVSCIEAKRLDDSVHDFVIFALLTRV